MTDLPGDREPPADGTTQGRAGSTAGPPPRPAAAPAHAPAPAASPVPEPSDEVLASFERHVRQQYTVLARYHARQMRKYRVARVVVIAAAGAVPVMTTVDGAPDWLIGLLGAVAAASEAFLQLFRWRDSAIAAMRAANEVEDHMTRFGLSLPPYDGDLGTAFQRYAEAVLRTGQEVSRVFAGLWSEDQPPSATTPAETRAVVA